MRFEGSKSVRANLFGGVNTSAVASLCVREGDRPSGRGRRCRARAQNPQRFLEGSACGESQDMEDHGLSIECRISCFYFFGLSRTGAASSRNPKS
jgi:hypothetical protein